MIHVNSLIIPTVWIPGRVLLDCKLFFVWNAIFSTCPPFCSIYSAVSVLPCNLDILTCHELFGCELCKWEQLLPLLMKSNVSATVLYQIKMPLVKADFAFIMKLTFKAFLVHTGISVARNFCVLEVGCVTSTVLLRGSRGVPGL